MYFKGLKLSIGMIFIVLLTLGMVLVNFVVVTLWHQHNVGVNVGQAKSFLSMLVDGELVSCRDVDNNNYESYLFFKKNLKNLNADLVLYHNNYLVTEIEDSKSQVHDFLRYSALSQVVVVNSIGRFWSMFGLLSEKIVVSMPLGTKCNGDSSIGIILNVPDIVAASTGKQSFIFVYILVNVIILTTIGFFRMSKIIIKPLEKLVNMSDHYGETGVGFLNQDARKNEFGHVATALHNMFSRIEQDKKKLNLTIFSLEEANKQILENQRNLIETEKFAVVGRLSAGLAHEIGNPLGIIQGYVELLGRDDINQVDRGQYTDRATKELDRVSNLIRQLIDMSKKDSTKDFRASIRSVVEELVGMLKLQKSCQKIIFEAKYNTLECFVLTSEDDLHQVLLNCLLNSIDAIGEKSKESGKITIDCCTYMQKNHKFTEIEIADDGSGIKQEDISKVFDPFFTTKEPGRGTGLGLSVSHSIIKKAGGTMQINSDGKNETIVRIMLPSL